MAASVGLGLRAFVQQTFAKNGFTTLLNQRQPALTDTYVCQACISTHILFLLYRIHVWIIRASDGLLEI